MNLKRLAGFVTDIGGRVFTRPSFRDRWGSRGAGPGGRDLHDHGGDFLILTETRGSGDQSHGGGLQGPSLNGTTCQGHGTGGLKYASLAAETRDGGFVSGFRQHRDGRRIPSLKIFGRKEWSLPYGDSYSNRRDPLTKRALPDLSAPDGEPTSGACHHPPPWTSRRQIPVNYPKGNEINPALGLRAIRFSMRKSTFSNPAQGPYAGKCLRKLRILIPMVSGCRRSGRSRRSSSRSRRGFQIPNSI